MYWTRGETNDSLVYPHRDMSVRFPALLTEAGVATYNHEGVGWLDALLQVQRSGDIGSPRVSGSTSGRPRSWPGSRSTRSPTRCRSTQC